MMTSQPITNLLAAIWSKKHIFRVGDRVETAFPIELPEMTVPVGTGGWVIDVDPEQPTDVVVRPDQSFPELEHWNYLVPTNAARLIKA
jgi:hypothetical protein